MPKYAKDIKLLQNVAVPETRSPQRDWVKAWAPNPMRQEMLVVLAAGSST